jgi:hypothetical protein
MFDAIGYVMEILSSRGVRASSIEYRTHIFGDDEYYLDLNARNGMIFFINPIQLPNETIITGDNNRIVLDDLINGTTAPDRIEEFTGQVIVELPEPPGSYKVIQYLQVQLA